MKTLGEEIKQTKPFESIEEEVFLNILQTADVLKHEIDDTLLAYGLNNYQYNVLRILRGTGEGGLEICDIHDRMINKTDELSNLCENLFSRGMISVLQRDKNNKIIKAEICNHGLDILVATHVSIQNRIKKNLSFIGAELLEQFNAFLVLARKNATRK
jgi:hypothetical protein